MSDDFEKAPESTKIPETPEEEAAFVRLGQQALLDNRRRIGLDGDARVPLPGTLFDGSPRPASARKVPKEFALPKFELPPPKASRCVRCKQAIVQRPGICEACAQLLADVEQAEAVERAIRREIPKHFAWSSWDAQELPARVRGGQRMVQAARAALESGAPTVVLIGAGRSGKTSLAAAWMRAVLESGNLGARWVSAWDLVRKTAPEGGPLPMDRAMTARTLLLDDLGAELAGAPIGSGLMAQRLEVVTQLVIDRHDRDMPMVITTAIGTDSMFTDPRSLRRSMAERYGDNVAGRLLEYAAVVPIGLPSPANDAGGRSAQGSR